MNSTRDEQAIATAELYSHLEQQVTGIAPEIPALVPQPIKVERVGMTRNASCTPYIVYRVGDRRCCTFVKRKVFFELGQALLKLVKGIEGKVCSVISSAERGIWVSTDEQREYIPSPYVDKIFERYNQIALERIAPQDNCGCNDLYNMCLHQIAQVLQPRLEECLPRPTVFPPKPKLSGYNPYARGRSAAMQNWKAYQQHKAKAVLAQTN